MVVTIGLCGAVTGVAAQRALPRVPPPLPSAYELLDLGSAPAATCTCVPHPLALAAYHPGWRYGTGAAAPLTDAPLSQDDRRRAIEWDAAEEREVPEMAEEGLAGNGNASLGVALHLATHARIFDDDRVEAQVVRWLTLAAEQGHRDAFPLLAHRYAVGQGVAQDYAVAAYWFDQGARHDDPISMTAIGFLRAAGRGVAQSWPEAIRWWRRAEGRTPFAARYLGDAYACGLGVDENHPLALAAYRRAAEHDVSGSVQLGHMYARGCAETDTDNAALDAFQRGADQGDPEAQIELSELLRQGRGAETNPYQAYLWARVAERRLDSGPLRKRADTAATAAARRMSAFEIADADRLVADLIARGAEPMR